MPVDYGEDFLQRIVGVHWREPEGPTGGVFIAGDGDGNIYFLRVGPGAKIDDTTGLPTWQNLGTLGVGYGWVQGSSYATVVDHEGNKAPVFVLVGGGGSAGGQGTIMASADGLSWTKVYQFGVDSATFIGANIFGVVWDAAGKAFYAGAHQTDHFGSAGGFKEIETDILLQSSDGRSWSEVGRNELVKIPPGNFPEYTAGLLAAHCSTRIVDSYGNGLPDGFYKYDSTSKIMIAPSDLPSIAYLTGGVGFSFPRASSVAVTNFGTGTTSPPSNTGIPTYCVAGIGESWMAGGGTFGSGGGAGTCQASYMVPSSDPGGMRWLPLNPPGTSPIVTMIGGEANKPPL